MPPSAVVTAALAGGVVEETAGNTTLSVTLSSASSQPVTLPLRFGGSATQGSDYTVDSNVIVTAPGQLTGSFTVTVIPDNVYEGDETIEISSSPTSANQRAGAAGMANVAVAAVTTITIREATAAPSVSLTASTVTIDENGTGATVTATIANASSSDVSITLNGSGSATAGSDYRLAPALLVIPAGSLSASTTLTPIDDSV